MIVVCSNLGYRTGYDYPAYYPYRIDVSVPGQWRDKPSPGWPVAQYWLKVVDILIQTQHTP